ncbi:MAG: alpha-glucan family phosphorylase, partial [Thermodesulfovibrionales bacterium]
MSLPIQEFISEPKIAYFSMEIGFRSEIHTYSGGLGVLAGDTIKSATDLKLPMVAVTLLTKKGYFKQELDIFGRQSELSDDWDPNYFMIPLRERVSVMIEGREVAVSAWLYVVVSATGGKIPVLFLDTDLPENDAADKVITHQLYGGDETYRLKQEIVLGLGGTRMLEELGFEIKKYHMNEGHSSLLTLELLRRYKKDVEEVWDERRVWDKEKVSSLCVFTTHTPVAAGHDKFSYELVEKVMGEVIPFDILKELGGQSHLNLTLLALNLSQYVNGVAKQHGKVSRDMFPGYEIHAITNGIHSFTWTSEPFKRIFD